MPAQPKSTAFESVIDVSASSTRIGSEVLTKDLVWQVYRRFGEIINVFPWESKSKKPHFYVEYESAKSASLAKNAALPEFTRITIIKDVQHQRRFIELSDPAFKQSVSGLSPKATRSGIRYAPYPTSQLPSSSNTHLSAEHAFNAPNSFPAGADYWDFRTLTRQRPYSLLPSYHDYADEMDLVEEDLVEYGESNGVDGAGDHDFTSTAPDQSTSLRSLAFQGSSQQMLKALSDLRETKASESGEPSAQRSRTHRIHPKFDFRNHISSGRFLVSDTNLTIDDHQTFQLTPLQAYFADIYGSLQSELLETKKNYKQNLFLLEQQKILCQRSRDEAADERSVRRETEKQLEDMRQALQKSTAIATAHRQAKEQYAIDLESARKEIEQLRRAIGHIQTICAEPAQVSETEPQ